MNGTSVLIKRTPESSLPCEDAVRSAPASGRCFTTPRAQAHRPLAPRAVRRKPVLCVSPSPGYVVTAAEED